MLDLLINLKKIILFIAILNVVSCQSSKKIKFKNQNINEIKTHLSSIHTKNELYEKYKQLYYANNKYKVYEYFFWEEEIKTSKFKSGFAKAKIGSIIFYKGTNGKGCSLIKKENSEILNSSKMRYIFLQNRSIPTGFSDNRISKKELLGKIEQGEDFGNLAKLHSESPTAKIDGGLSDWTIQGILRPEIEAESMNHSKGDVFVVENELGVFIFKIELDWKKRKLYNIIEIEIRDCLN
jgi:hypothetical protein